MQYYAFYHQFQPVYHSVAKYFIKRKMAGDFPLPSVVLFFLSFPLLLHNRENGPQGNAAQGKGFIYPVVLIIDNEVS